MKKLAVYALIVAQISIILVLVFLYERFEGNAATIIVETKIEYGYMDDTQLRGNIYAEYNINHIDQEIAATLPEYKYNRPLFVTLRPNEAGIHEVIAVSNKKPKPAANEVVLRGNYQWKDDDGNIYVLYGFELIEDIEQFGTFHEKDRLQVTVLVGKYGKQKISAIEKIGE